MRKHRIPKKKYLVKHRKQKGFTLIEVMIAASILAISVTGVTALQAQVYQQVRRTNDRAFAAQKATQMFEELRSFVQANREEPLKSLQDYFSNGANEFVSTLTTEKRPDVTDPNNRRKDYYLSPLDPLSANEKRGDNWKYTRQVTVEPVPTDENARHVTVKVWYANQANEPTNEDMPLAVISGILKTNIDKTPPTQVYDIYALGLENVSGWWVDVSTLRPIFDRTLDDLASRNPGLELRKHYITRLGYGRDPFYTPYINTASDLRDTNTPFVYMYPGNISSSTDTPRVTEVYVDDVISGRRLNDDSSETFNAFKANDSIYANTDNSLGKYRGYAMADQYNTIVRFPEEMATYRRLNAQYRATHTNDTDLEPSLRMLLEGMYSDPENYRNAMIANLHGELLPLPPVRNYADPAKTPCDETFDAVASAGLQNNCLDPRVALSDTNRDTNFDELRYSNMRVVTHPENIYLGNSDPVNLRVYAYETRHLGQEKLPTWPRNSDPTSADYRRDMERSQIEKTSVFIPTDGAGRNPINPGSPNAGYLENPLADMSSEESDLLANIQVTKIVGNHRKAYEKRTATGIANRPFMTTTNRDIYVDPATKAAEYTGVPNMQDTAFWSALNNKVQPIVLGDIGNGNGVDDNANTTVDDAGESRAAGVLLNDSGTGLGRVWNISGDALTLKVSNTSVAANLTPIEDLIDELIVIGANTGSPEIRRVRGVTNPDVPMLGFVTLELYGAPTGTYSHLVDVVTVTPGTPMSTTSSPGSNSSDGTTNGVANRVRLSSNGTYNFFNVGDIIRFDNSGETHVIASKDGSRRITLATPRVTNDFGSVSRVDVMGTPSTSNLKLGITAADLNPSTDVYDPDVYPLVTRHKDYDVTGQAQTPFGLETDGVLLTLYDTPTRHLRCGEVSGISCSFTAGVTNADRTGMRLNRDLYEQEYIPAPVDGNNFNRDLTEATDNVVKNTARWRVSIDRSALPAALQNTRLTFETRIGRTREDVSVRDSAAENTALLEQGLSADGDLYRPNDPGTGPNENEISMRLNPYNVSRTYVWSGDANGDGTSSMENDVPLSEQFQYMGDPRFMPYLDVKINEGYNPAFVDNLNNGHETGNGTGYSGITIRGTGMTGSSGIDFARYGRLFVDPLMKSSSIFNSMSGFSNYYYGLGGDMGADSNNTLYNVNKQSFTIGNDTGNVGIANSLVADIDWGSNGLSKLVYSNDGTGQNRWAGIFWQGDMFPDEEYSFWKFNGNLPTEGFNNGTQNLCPTGYTTGTEYACQRTGSKKTYWRGSYNQDPFSLPNRKKNPGPKGSVTFMNANITGTGDRNFAHDGGETTGTLTTIAGAIVNRAFNLSLEARPGANRPFKIDADQDKPGVYSNALMSAFRNTSALIDIQTGLDEGSIQDDNTYYRKTGDASKIVSATVKLSRGADYPGGYVLVNGLKKAGTSSEVSLARFSVAGMLQSYLNGNDVSDSLGDEASRMRLIPRIEITEPSSSNIYEDETTIGVGFRSQWLRWDLEKYSPAFPASWREDLDVRFIFKYSDDAGKTWIYLDDDTDAGEITGVYDSNHVYDESGVKNFTVPGGATGLEKTVNWDVSAFEGTYLLRVEAYRMENNKVLKNGYSYHQTFVTFRKNS